jgi:hypothetical protein
MPATSIPRAWSDLRAVDVELDHVLQQRFSVVERFSRIASACCSGTLARLANRVNDAGSDGAAAAR